MPSGAKKRKAARRRKENQSVTTTHSNEDDDVKKQDDKDSDVGELTSPNSHDNDSHQSLSTEGEEEENEKGKITSDTPSEEALRIRDSEEKSMTAQDDCFVPVDREFEIEDKSSKIDDGSSSQSSGSSNSIRSGSDDESYYIKNGEAATDNTPVVDPRNDRESLSGVQDEKITSAAIEDGSNNFCSSSDDESHYINNGEAAIDNTPVVDPGNDSKSLSGVQDEKITSAEIGDGSNSIRSSSDDECHHINNGEAAMDNTLVVDPTNDSESLSGVQDEKITSAEVGDGSNSIHSSSDDESHYYINNGEAAIDNTLVVDPRIDSESLSGVPDEKITKAEIGDGVDLVVENSPAEELKNTSTLWEKVETDTDSPTDSSVASYIVEPVESEKKWKSFIEDKADISTVFMDVPLKRKEVSIENILTTDPKECLTQESDDRVANGTGVVLEKDSGVTELLLVPAPPPGQATSWKSCCGLFEVFTGSGR